MQNLKRVMLFFVLLCGGAACSSTPVTPANDAAVDTGGGGNDSGGGDAAAAATWTQLHAEFLASCAGGSCHSANARSPRIAQSDSAAAYAAANSNAAAILASVTATTGRVMPDGRSPNTPWAGAPLLRSWLAAGKPNN